MDRDSHELSHDIEISFKQNVLFDQVHSSSTKYLYRYNKTTLVIIYILDEFDAEKKNEM